MVGSIRQTEQLAAQVGSARPDSAFRARAQRPLKVGLKRLVEVDSQFVPSGQSGQFKGLLLREFHTKDASLQVQPPNHVWQFLPVILPGGPQQWRQCVQPAGGQLVQTLRNENGLAAKEGADLRQQLPTINVGSDLNGA